MSSDDRALAERARKGDRLAFRQLLESHYDMIYRVAYRFTGHAEDAEDVAQDICIKLADKLASFRGDSSFSTWLYRITVNACRDFFKKQGNRRALDKTFIEVDALERAGSDDTNRQIASIYRAIATLEESLKETALLVLTEELSHAEAGKILGCAESTVSWRMHEVRKQLKQIMDGSHG